MNFLSRQESSHSCHAVVLDPKTLQVDPSHTVFALIQNFLSIRKKRDARKKDIFLGQRDDLVEDVDEKLFGEKIRPNRRFYPRGQVKHY